MDPLIRTRTFKSGNSVAVRLPKGFAIPANADVELEKSGDVVTVRITRSPSAEKLRLETLVQALRSLSPAGADEARDRIEFPDRPGLY